MCSPPFCHSDPGASAQYTHGDGEPEECHDADTGRQTDGGEDIGPAGLNLPHFVECYRNGVFRGEQAISADLWTPENHATAVRERDANGA